MGNLNPNMTYFDCFLCNISNQTHLFPSLPSLSFYVITDSSSIYQQKDSGIFILFSQDMQVLLTSLHYQNFRTNSVKQLPQSYTLHQSFFHVVSSFMFASLRILCTIYKVQHNTYAFHMPMLTSSFSPLQASAWNSSPSLIFYQ